VLHLPPPGRRKVDTNLEREVCSAGDEVLQPGFIQPGAAIIQSVFAEYQLAYRAGRLGRYVPAASVFEPPAEPEETGEITPYSDASYIPCMTAIAIEYLKRGAGNLSRYKQKRKHPGAE